MKKVLYILAAVLALQSGVRADDAKPQPAAISAKAKCSYCGDDCKCAAGQCPGKCPVKAKGNADAAWAAVAKGERVVLCVGVPAVDGAYATASKKGYTDGVYECFLHNGTPSMVSKAATCANGRCGYPASYYGFANPVSPFDTPCANGNCPNVRKR